MVQVPSSRESFRKTYLFSIPAQPGRLRVEARPFAARTRHPKPAVQAGGELARFAEI
jgi:hypothetical protein